MITFKQFLYEQSFNDDDWYLVDTKTKTVVRHVGGPSMRVDPKSYIKNDDQDVLKGMRAKHQGYVFESTVGDHGEYKNDASEKTMIHKIMDLCIQKDGSTCPRIEKNYDTAYSFIESDIGGEIWDKFYELFHEKNPNFEGPQNKSKFTRFKNEVRKAFEKWQKGSARK